MGKRGQVSVEYLMVIGFSLLITVPMVIILYNHTDMTRDQVTENQARQVVRKIVDSAEKIYYYGEPSMTTLKVYIPERVDNVTITSREVSFAVRTSHGVADIAEASTVNLTGTLLPESGLQFIRIQVIGSNVQISSLS